VTLTELRERLAAIPEEFADREVTMSIFFRGLGERVAPVEDIATSERTGVILIYEGPV
jgi:hypothetical protein